MPKTEIHLRPQAKRRLHRHLDQVGCHCGWSGPHLRISTGNIERAEDDVSETMRVAEIAQRHFSGQLGFAVGRQGQRRSVLRYRNARRIAIIAAVEEKMN